MSAPTLRRLYEVWPPIYKGIYSRIDAPAFRISKASQHDYWNIYTGRKAYSQNTRRISGRVEGQGVGSNNILTMCLLCRDLSRLYAFLVRTRSERQVEGTGKITQHNESPTDGRHVIN